MKKYVIERTIPGIDTFSPEDCRAAAATSNAALAQLAPRVQWIESYVVQDKTFCVYLAENAAAVEEHARLSGFPADRISEVVRMLSPLTAY